MTELSHTPGRKSTSGHNSTIWDDFLQKILFNNAEPLAPTTILAL